MFRSSLFRIGGIAVALGLGQSAYATVFAQYDGVSWAPGALDSFESQFNNPQVIGTVLDDPQAQTILGNTPGMTGLPGATNPAYVYPGIVSPFDPPYDTDQLVAVGVGGQITVKFNQPVSVGSGASIGVFSSVGLADNNYPVGVASDPATTLSTQTAVVSVSADNIHWYSLGVQSFDIPENYYLNAVTPYDAAPPANPQIANFGQPFTGTLDSFDGEDYQQILATLGGSAGGTWLNLSSTGLSEIQYVQFTEPAGVVPDGSYLTLEGVSASDLSVPEPAGLLSLCALAGLLRRRKRIS
jgi:hypothetical protein